MLKSKLIELIGTMSKEELKQFDDFVSSTFFNKDTSVLSLLRYIRKQIPVFDGVNLKKEKVYSILFPGKKYNDKVMRNKMSKLMKLGERFININNFENKATDKYNYLLDELLNRRLPQHFENVYTEATKLLDKESRNEEHFFNTVSILSSRRNFELASNIKMENVLSTSVITEPLFGFFLIYFVKISHTTMIFKHNYENYSLSNMEPEYKLIKNIYEYIIPRAQKYKPVFDIYFNMFMMNYITEDEEYFRSFRTSVNNHAKLFSKPDLYNFFVAMQNYCIAKKKRRTP